MYKGDFNKALYYELDMMRSMEKSGDSSSAGSFYFDLGFIYRQIGQFQKGIDYYEIAFDHYKKNRATSLFDVRVAIAEAMQKLGKNNEALDLLENTLVQYPPQNNYEMRAIEGTQAGAHRILKNYDQAEIHLKKANSTTITIIFKANTPLHKMTAVDHSRVNSLPA